MKYLLTIFITFNIYARDLIVSFGQELPPYIIAEKDSGIIIDLLKECLKGTDHKIIPKYYPYSRRIVEYQEDHIDILSDANENIIASKNLKGYFSGYVYAYENYAITLSKSNFNFSKIDELKNHSILSWQGAIDHLGGEYAKMAKSNKKYRETHSQLLQVKMLYLGRIDVIQMDMEIFKYYREILKSDKKINIEQPLNSFSLFGKSPNGFLFKDEAIQKVCKSNLEKMKEENSKYAKIINHAQK